MRRLTVMLLAASAAAGCLPEEDEVPARAPVAEQAPARPAEHVVVSNLTMVGGSTPQGGSSERGTSTGEVGSRASDMGRFRDPVFFHLGAGYGAIGRVDLAPCRELGLDPGYVHMRVTFGGGGQVVRAIVESLTQPSPEALECISEHLAPASVPTFEGGDVTLSKSLFVATDGRSPDLFVKSEVTPHGTQF
jgi:hypothetical protein